MDSYETWIIATEKELQEAVAAAEDAGWHHAQPDTVEARTYGRILTWLSAIERRKSYLDVAKRR